MEDRSIVDGAFEAWWHDCDPAGYRVQTFDVASAAFIGWDIQADGMRLARWSPADGLSEVTGPRTK